MKFFCVEKNYNSTAPKHEATNDFWLIRNFISKFLQCTYLMRSNLRIILHVSKNNKIRGNSIGGNLRTL